MFYSHFILAKKGPLGTIWIAAHLEAKLRKNQVADTNITESVDSILFSEVPIALRLSGHLLLGVVRIYSRKVNYLFQDCSEALLKIKQAFQVSAVDLPPEAAKVPFHSITLPETFDFDDFDITFRYDTGSFGDFVDRNISARDLITLQERTQDDNRNPLYMLDERLPTDADPYSLLDDTEEDHVPKEGSTSQRTMPASQSDLHHLEEDVLPPFQMDDTMDIHGDNFEPLEEWVGRGHVMTPPVHITTQGSFVAANGVATPMETLSPPQSFPEIEKLRAATERRHVTPLFMELDDGLLPHTDNGPETVANNEYTTNSDILYEVEATPAMPETPAPRRPSPSTVDALENYKVHDDLLGDILGVNTPVLRLGTPQLVESAQKKRSRKKRKIFDEKVIISSFFMKKQLADTSDICRQRKRNPSSEFDVWRSKGSYHDEMFARPTLHGVSAPLTDLYRHVTKLSAVESPSKPKAAGNASMNGKEGSRLGDIEEQANRYPEWPRNVIQTPETQHFEFSPVHIDDAIDMENQDVMFHASMQPEMDGVVQRAHELFVELEIEPQDPESSRRTEANDDSIHEDSSRASARMHDDHGGDMFDENTMSPDEIQEPREERADSGTFTSPMPDAMPEKLDFLEERAETDTFDEVGSAFVGDADIHDRRKGRPNQTYSSNDWSVRTKAVANYLKALFEKIEQNSGSQRPAQISLDDLLKGRTRKEAARMYFETLVLKSRAFLNVEQTNSFGEIRLSATSLLRKEIP